MFLLFSYLLFRCKELYYLIISMWVVVTNTSPFDEFSTKNLLNNMQREFVNTLVWLTFLFMSQLNTLKAKRESPPNNNHQVKRSIKSKYEDYSSFTATTNIKCGHVCQFVVCTQNNPFL